MFEAINSLFDNYKSKIRNPLIGTMISVWIIHNWKITYALFNFDQDCTMQDKINYIQGYFLKKNIIEEVWTITWITFLVIIFTFILLAISRGITDSYYKIAEPFIINLLDKKTIFTHIEKKKLEDKIIELNNKLERLRDSNSKSENQNILLLSRMKQIEDENDKNLLEISEQSLKNTKTIELLETKNINANKVVTFFDDIINGLSSEMKKELSIYLEHKDDIKTNSFSNFVGLRTILQNIGVLINENGILKTPALGILFLEYFKITQENELPF